MLTKRQAMLLGTLSLFGICFIYKKIGSDQAEERPYAILKEKPQEIVPSKETETPVAMEEKPLPEKRMATVEGAPSQETELVIECKDEEPNAVPIAVEAPPQEADLVIEFEDREPDAVPIAVEAPPQETDLVIECKEGEPPAVPMAGEVSPSEPACVIEFVEEKECDEVLIIATEETPIAEEAIDSRKKRIRGIVLIGEKKEWLDPEALGEVRGLRVVGIDVPGPYKELWQIIQSRFIGQEWEEESFQEIKKTLYDYYRYWEHPFVWVSIPSQDSETEVVQVVVQESKLGKVSVVGNQWTPSKRIEKYFKLTPGDPISQRQVAKDLNFANRNPFRRVGAVYAPGDQKNTTDLILEVEDRKPYRFYVGFDNTGVLSTGRQRAYAGFSWDQLFNLDHVFFYQYTTNYDVKRFHANTFQYMAMLPWESILNFFGGFSILHADFENPVRRNKGTNIQTSMRYHIPCLPFHTFTQEWIFGFDWKNTNNTMEFVDSSPVFGQTVNLTQFVLGYQWGWDGGPHAIRSGAEFLCSPMEWLPDQTDADFSSLRPSAKNKWGYGVFFFNYRRALPRSCSYTALFRGQWSSQVLLPSEQLGLGGYDTIRGYDQRQFNADNGFLLSQELHSAPLSLIRGKKKITDKLYCLLFLDAGYGVDKVPVPNVPSTDWLMGVGPGFRYHWGSYLNARLDWGIKLHQQADFTGGASMVHFSVSGSY